MEVTKMKKERQIDLTKRMGTMPESKLLLSMSLPAIVSMLVQALYNVVDSIYVSKITMGSEKEITALNYAFPMQMIMLAFALGIGIGTNSLISRRLGEKNNEAASKAASTGLIIAIGCYLCFFVFSFFLPKLFLSIYEFEDPSIAAMSNSYMRIVMAFSFGMFIEMCISKILQATGNMKIPMYTLLLGACTNIILDPIFIFKPHQGIGLPFGLGLGVNGAAIVNYTP